MVWDTNGPPVGLAPPEVVGVPDHTMPMMEKKMKRGREPPSGQVVEVLVGIDR